ncbi:MAG: antibiotic biosynthesis monooxygenase [Armatimonadetes bacterium]|nr:antibiotic biosynthesis monooxygenase [Anaerolineae bacterium]
MAQSVELIRFRVTEAHVAAFIEQRAHVDTAMHTLAGFLNSELIQVSADQWLLIVRWESREAVIAAQAITRDMSIISDWIKLADEFVSFDTADVRYQSN